MEKIKPPEMDKSPIAKRAIQMGSTGAQIGGFLGGPVGAAIGFGVAASAGAVFGGLEARDTFRDQMELYGVSKEQQKINKSMQKEMQRQMKRKVELDKRASGQMTPLMSEADQASIALGSVSGYDQHMKSMYG